MQMILYPFTELWEPKENHLTGISSKSPPEKGNIGVLTEPH